MAAPTIKFKRGSQANLPALAAGEPAFVNDEYNLYLGLDGTTNNNKFLGSARYWSKETASTGQAVKLHAKTGAGGGGSVSLKAPDTSATNTTYTLPATPTDGYFLKTDTNGNMTWAEVVSTLTLAADSGAADQVSTGSTITFTGGEGIDTTVSDNTITIAAELATDTNAGVAIFPTSDFAVSSGSVTINAERVQDIVGAMVTSTNQESGIAVTYDDTNGHLDFNVADFTITLAGDLSGSVTVTDLANATLTATIEPNSVALGTDTTGNYVGDVTAGAGLAKTSSASEGQTVDLAIGAGIGITVNADDVQLKNGGALTDATVMGWDNTNDQLVNAPITYSGNDVSVAGDLKVGGNDIKASDGTTAITLAGANVTIAGNLTVSGSTTTSNSTITTYDDPVLELGTVSGAAPSSATNTDRGFRFHYYDTSAKTSAMFWDGNTGFLFVDNCTEAAGPQLSGTLADVQMKGLWLGSFGTATNQVLNNNAGTFELINTLVDGGTF
jgi:hypothetical protein